MRAPEGRRRKVTDEQLRADLEAGLTPAQIADKRGVTDRAVRKRIKQLEQTTVAAAVAPAESKRFVSATFNAIEELTKVLQRVNLLQDACDRYLRDPRDPKRYDVGARAEDLDVIYWRLDEDGEKIGRKPERASLQTLISRAEHLGDREVIAVETKHADPRSLILQTAAEVRQTVSQGVELLRMLRDSQAMEAFREELLRAVGEADPETRARIEERLRSRLVVYAAASGLGVLPGEAGPA